MLGWLALVDSSGGAPGKLEENEVVMAHPSISRSHALVVLDQAHGAFLVDLGASNGTFVDGKVGGWNAWVSGAWRAWRACLRERSRRVGEGKRGPGAEHGGRHAPKRWRTRRAGLLSSKPFVSPI